VSIAADGQQAVHLAVANPPDLLVLDIMMPKLDGFGVLQQLRAAGFSAPALMLSARSDEADKVRGFRLGADDYVTKPFGLLELLARLDALLRRAGAAAAPGADAAVFRFGDVVVDAVSRVVTRAGVPVPLSRMEFTLLLTFVSRPRTALARADLLRDVWGHAPDIRTRTVDIHVAELRRKLEPVPADPRHFLTVWKTGYRFSP
jgi:DNA-binding response OmpR family regulator